MAAQPGIQHLKSVARRIVSTMAARPSVIALVIAVIVPLGWVAYDIWLGPHDIHAPAPVAKVHERFNCRDCHGRPWQPVESLIAADQNLACSALDEACVRCHQGLVHHREEIRRDTPNCVSCHHEHQGPDALTAVADGSCTTCHSGLRTAAGPSTRYVSRVIDFASHPEFAVLRRALPDGGRIRFNHAKHLPPAGLPGLGGKAVALKCASCHQPAPDGRSMGPISFRAHCASCHWNTLSYDVARFRDLGVPHGVQPELLRGLIRERYTQFIHKSSGELKRDQARPRRPIPGWADRHVPTETEWAWVSLQVENADRILFQSSSGCRYCHNVEGSTEVWQVSPTNIARRWFGHSQFSHFSHRLSPKPPADQELSADRENCTACHAFARRSTETVDVLMPSIRKCHECHDPKANPTERAPNDCVTCHIYHNEVGGRRPLDLTLLLNEREAVVKHDRIGPQLTAMRTRANQGRVLPTALPRECSSIIAWLSGAGPQSPPLKTP